MKKQQAGKPIDEELLMRMMAGEIEKLQSNGDAPETEETVARGGRTGNRKQRKGKLPCLRRKHRTGKPRTASGARQSRRRTTTRTFLKGMDIPARYGKPVYVRREYHERIAKISMMLTGGKVSLIRLHRQRAGTALRAVPGRNRGGLRRKNRKAYSNAGRNRHDTENDNLRHPAVLPCRAVAIFPSRRDAVFLENGYGR